MYLQLLAYAIPLYDAFATIATLHPLSYREPEETSGSEFSNRIKNMTLGVCYNKKDGYYEKIQDVMKKKIQEVLAAENVVGMDHYEKIQYLINNLPPSNVTKNVDAVATSRFKVVFQSHAIYPVYSYGTDIDVDSDEGRFSIVVNPAITEVVKDALPWITAHEICHCLELDTAGLALAKFIASFAAVTFSTFVLGGGAFAVVGSAFAARAVFSAIVCRRMVSRADDFANKHSSQEELEKAIGFLEDLKGCEPKSFSDYYAKAMNSIYYPLEDARIAKIRAAILSRFGEEEASA